MVLVGMEEPVECAPGRCVCGDMGAGDGVVVRRGRTEECWSRSGEGDRDMAGAVWVAMEREGFIGWGLSIVKGYVSYFLLVWETLMETSLGEKGFICLTLSHHSLSLRDLGAETQAGTWRQKPEQECCLPADLP